MTVLRLAIGDLDDRFDTVLLDAIKKREVCLGF